MKIREMILQCDRVMKAVTVRKDSKCDFGGKFKCCFVYFLKVAYCQMQHRLASPAPIQFEALCEKSQLYEPGKAMSLPEQLQFEFRFPNVAP